MTEPLAVQPGYRVRVNRFDGVHLYTVKFDYVVSAIETGDRQLIITTADPADHGCTRTTTYNSHAWTWWDESRAPR